LHQQNRERLISRNDWSRHWPACPDKGKPAKDVAKFGADTPMKRPAQPEEIAPAYVYFASDVDSSYVTGEVLTLLGGETTAA
jgi:NAD(P)-dependent dehydrogenase (short-subunit alcohol dehydrogenase family)